MNKPAKILYVGKGKATGGRDGRVTAVDSHIDLKMTTPKELGGGGGEGANPEQLFACGYAACFIGAMKFVAMQKKIKLPADLSIENHVGIGPVPGGFGIDVDMHISIPGMDKNQGMALVEKAHKVCPYSNATRGNIEVRFHIV